MTFVSTIVGQFSYFNQQLGEPVWRGKNVLDFGGNIGNMLQDPASTIDAKRYWCLDVDQMSVERGKTTFPTAHWLFYDRYCFFFNPYGTPHLPVPALGVSFDYVLAFSVFTNTTESDMLELVSQLKGILKKNGVLAFTFIDPYHFSWPREYKGNNFQWRLDLERERGHVSRVRTRELSRQVGSASWFTLVNGNDLYLETDNIPSYEPAQQKTFHVFHTAQYMKRLFPEADILPPVNDEMQHCCVIRKS